MPKSKKVKKSSAWKNPTYIIVAVIVLAAGAYLLIRHYDHTTVANAPASQSTQQEEQQNNQNKQSIVQQQQNSQKSTSGKQQVSVTITNATPSSVSAYVTGVFESSGTCTATFTQGSTTVTRTSSGFGNASYTQCSPITPDLPNTNSWSVTVSYSSSTAEGTSQAQSF